jgi:phage tail-like protein
VDANGTRYHLLLGEADWGACAENGVALSTMWSAAGSPPATAASFYWNASRGEMTLWPLLYLFPPGAEDKKLTPDARRGAAADRFGNFYFVDPTRTQILVQSSGDGSIAAFWPPAAAAAPPRRGGAFGPLGPATAPPVRTLSALAVTRHHYLVATIDSPPALLVFDLYEGGAPREVLWPATVPFAPADMAAAPGGGVFILDRTNRRYWELDAHFTVRARGQGSIAIAAGAVDRFQPLAGGPVRRTPTTTFPEGHLLDGASPVTASDPIAIEALPDGSVLILDRGGDRSWIEHYRGGTRLEAPYPIDSVTALLPADPAPSFAGHDFVFVANHGGSGPLAGRVLVALSSGCQCLSFGVTSASGGAEGSIALQPLPDYYPMRRFGGRAVIDAGGVPQYDFVDRFIPLVAQKRPQYRPQGTLTTAAFDSATPGCAWHRVILEASIPVDSSITLWSRAADDLAALDATPFLREPQNLYRRVEGSELPFATVSAGLASWELLFQQARGRFLQLQIVFSGSGRHSPRVRALRAYFPRFSYVKQYLPAVYADGDSFGFLERFMANMEGTLTAVEDRVAAAQALLDPRSAPADALAWLASWFGVALDPAWDEVRQRLFIRYAMVLFQWRGTTRGIQMALDLALAPDPSPAIFDRDDDALPAATRIIETYATRLMPAIVAGDPTASTLAPPSGAARWTPDQGGGALVALWSAAAQAAGLAVQTSFPVSAPSDAATAGAWSAFTAATLGFTPSSTSADDGRWRAFLARRYSSLSALAVAYGITYPSFASIARFASLPPDGPALFDWFQFEGVVMSIARTAHRFRVLIPLPPGGSADAATQQQQLDLVTRLVQLEKPAHTSFDVRFYWAMFRVGQVRLGYDTLLDQGSRIPQLAPSMVLGLGHLLEGHLAPGFPQDATDRSIVGGDSIGAGLHS